MGFFKEIMNSSFFKNKTRINKYEPKAGTAEAVYIDKLQDSASKLGTTDRERNISKISSGLASGDIDMNPKTSQYYDKYRNELANNQNIGAVNLTNRGNIVGTSGRTGTAKYNTLSNMSLSDAMGKAQSNYQNQYSPLNRAMLSANAGNVDRQGQQRQSEIYNQLVQHGKTLKPEYQMSTDPSYNAQAASIAGQVVSIIGAVKSDVRLKQITSILDNGPFNVPNCSWYTWKWNDKAEELGLKGFSCGLIAQEVQKMYPESVIQDSDGYLMIDYKLLMEALK